MSSDICESMRNIQILLEKHGPLCMKAAGGPTENEHEAVKSDGRKKSEAKPPTVITNQMVAKMIMWQAPPHSLPMSEIAKRLGVASSTVLKHLQKAGVWKRRCKWQKDESQ